ncbi:hypothetical protein B0H14DRAFT_3616246 [Mycena olivaceomarginata]|nr:hypothetical protein B0H14DRAFT_3616246 [Mycena olivaceomarginata]
MASSLSLIPWNQPDANKAVAKIDENSRPEGGKWGLVLHAFSFLNPSPGRTLDQVYRSLAKAVEKQANRAEYSLGLGPHVVANKIKAYFGDGEERGQRLELLRTSVPPKLEKRCLKLMNTESGSTQRQAFKEITVRHRRTTFPLSGIVQLANCLIKLCMVTASDLRRVTAYPLEIVITAKD